MQVELCRCDGRLGLTWSPVCPTLWESRGQRSGLGSINKGSIGLHSAQGVFQVTKLTDWREWLWGGATAGSLFTLNQAASALSWPNSHALPQARSSPRHLRVFLFLTSFFESKMLRSHFPGEANRLFTTLLAGLTFQGASWKKGFPSLGQRGGQNPACVPLEEPQLSLVCFYFLSVFSSSIVYPPIRLWWPIHVPLNLVT